MTTLHQDTTTPARSLSVASLWVAALTACVADAAELLPPRARTVPSLALVAALTATVAHWRSRDRLTEAALIAIGQFARADEAQRSVVPQN